MKNRNTYKFHIGKRILSFKANTTGGAYDKAIHWQKKYAPMQNKPIQINNEQP
jgi:hypothetical protein